MKPRLYIGAHILYLSAYRYDRNRNKTTLLYVYIYAENIVMCRFKNYNAVENPNGNDVHRQRQENETFIRISSNLII